MDYKFEDGSIIHLISDLPNDDIDMFGYIDLLIDENNLNNFYIDFNIKKY